MSFERKSQQEVGKWTEYCLKKENGPRASFAPALELNTIIFKHVYWYMQQISGERLQDHWSSGLNGAILFDSLSLFCRYFSKKKYSRNLECLTSFPFLDICREQ